MPMSHRSNAPWLGLRTGARRCEGTGGTGGGGSGLGVTSPVPVPVAVDGRDDGTLVAGDPTSCIPVPLPTPARRACDAEANMASCSSTSSGGFSIERRLCCCCRLLFTRWGSVRGTGGGRRSLSNTGVAGEVGAVACIENESRTVCEDADEDAADVLRVWRRNVSSESRMASSGYAYVAVRGYPKSS